MPEKTLTYIALLRGINVSGHNMIKMADLKRVFANLGFSNVQTYLQSGNVVFDSVKKFGSEIRIIIENEILTAFGLSVPVIVLEKDTLLSIQNECPLSSENLEKTAVYITFPAEKMSVDAFQKLVLPLQPKEGITCTENAIYLYLPTGYGRTKLNNNFFEKKLKIVATTRNWKTVNELLILAGQQR